jgi:hypothetical protein
MQMTENKQQRPILTASFSVVFAAAEIFRAREMSGRNWRAPLSAFRAPQPPGSRETPRISRHSCRCAILKLHNAPVDITVDKRSSTSSEKPQQNQHFKYHRVVRYLYHDANKALIPPQSISPAPSRRTPLIVTLVWNMHRSGAACSLNVTSIGICLSRQHVRSFRNRAFFVPEFTAAVDSPGMRDYSETDLWNARWPTSQGFFRGLHESA